MCCIGIMIHNHLVRLSQSFVEMAKSYLRQLFKLVKGIWILTNRCDTVYSMGTIINPFMLRKPPTWRNPFKVLRFGFTQRLNWKFTFPAVFKLTLKAPPGSAALKFWFVKASFKHAEVSGSYTTQSCVCLSVGTPSQRRKLSHCTYYHYSCN